MITPIGQFRLYRWCVVMINIRGQPKTECAYESFKSFQPIFFFSVANAGNKKNFQKIYKYKKRYYTVVVRSRWDIVDDQHKKRKNEK
jgi:hypothetical protein